MADRSMSAQIFSKKGLLRVLISFVFVVLIAELIIRLSGIMDVPLYNADPVLGYVPRPNQTGKYLNRHPWVFNNKSMGVSAAFRPKRSDILMLGDSIVYGGVRMNNSMRLGPLVGRLSRRMVWPLSASSWGVENELTAYHVITGTRDVDTIILVSNTADFDQPSVWRSELTHPRSYPRLMSIYLIQKLISERFSGVASDPKAAPIVSDRALHALKFCLSTFHGRVIWVLYPKRAELGHEPALFEQLRRIVGDRVEYIYPARDPKWTSALYQDEIHPTLFGNQLLARMIVTRLEATTRDIYRPVDNNTIAQGMSFDERPRSHPQTWHRRLLGIIANHRLYDR